MVPAAGPVGRPKDRLNAILRALTDHLERCSFGRPIGSKARSGEIVLLAKCLPPGSALGRLVANKRGAESTPEANVEHRRGAGDRKLGGSFLVWDGASKPWKRPA